MNTRIQTLILGAALLAISPFVVNGDATAQSSFDIESYATKVNGDQNDADIDVALGLHNVSLSAKDIKVRREVMSEVSGTINYFCWAGQCFGENTDTSETMSSKNSGECDNTFIGYYEPLGNTGQTVVKYCFYDSNNPTDEECITITYEGDGTLLPTGIQTICTLTGIEDLRPSKTHLGGARPNPASNSTIISYELKNLSNGNDIIRVHDMLGQQVQEFVLDSKIGQVEVDVADLPSGLYFYSMQVGGDVISSKKLVVTH